MLWKYALPKNFISKKRDLKTLIEAIIIDNIEMKYGYYDDMYPHLNPIALDKIMNLIEGNK